MNKEQVIERMYDCIDYADMKGFEKEVEHYLSICDLPTAAQDFAMFLTTQYTVARADTMAKLLEIIIRVNPEIALVKYPENKFFIAILATGSHDLLEVYMEEAIEPYLENKSEEESQAYYKELLHLGVQLVSKFATQYEPIIKGVHYNGPFSNDNGVLSIHSEDYEVMQDTVDNYNKLVGRRSITETLMINAGIEF